MRVTRSKAKTSVDITVIKSEIELVKHEVDEDTSCGLVSTAAAASEVPAPAGSFTSDLQVVEACPSGVTSSSANVLTAYPVPDGARPDDAVGIVLDTSAPGGAAYCT